jgi:hypothetical protein
MPMNLASTIPPIRTDKILKNRPVFDDFVRETSDMGQESENSCKKRWDPRSIERSVVEISRTLRFL